MRVCVLAILLPTLAALPACRGGERDRTDHAAGAVRTVTAWVHAGQEAERRTIEDQVARFNAGQDSIRVDLTSLPEGTYDAQVQAAALADELPDLLELDGPYVYGYIWQGRLAPIDDLLPDSVRADLIPSIVEQGTYSGRLYATGTFDSGLCLYASRRLLDAAGVRIPTGISDAWSADEMDDALAALAARDDDGAVLDLKMNDDATEWITFAFSPIVESAGGDLVDRSNYASASGVLDSDASVRALTRVQAWFSRGYVDPNTANDAFVGGRVALSWGGHWEYPRYHEALGDDLVLVPLPDFGEGPRTGQGSWVWGVTRHATHRADAAAFVTFLLRPEEVLEMVEANGGRAGDEDGRRTLTLHRPGGPLHLFVAQLDSIAVPRPKTPGYAVITTSFATAFRDIRDGADVREALTRAAREIDRDIADTRGYPPRTDGD